MSRGSPHCATLASTPRKVRPAARAPTRPSSVESRVGLSRSHAFEPRRRLQVLERLSGCCEQRLGVRFTIGRQKAPCSLEPGERQEERQLELAEHALRDPKLGVGIGLRQVGAEASPERANGRCHLAGRAETSSRTSKARSCSRSPRAAATSSASKSMYFPSPARSRPSAGRGRSLPAHRRGLLRRAGGTTRSSRSRRRNRRSPTARCSRPWSRPPARARARRAPARMRTTCSRRPRANSFVASSSASAARASASSQRPSMSSVPIEPATKFASQLRCPTRRASSRARSMLVRFAFQSSDRPEQNRQVVVSAQRRRVELVRERDLEGAFEENARLAQAVVLHRQHRLAVQRLDEGLREIEQLGERQCALQVRERPFRARR